VLNAHELSPVRADYIRLRRTRRTNSAGNLCRPQRRAREIRL